MNILIPMAGEGSRFKKAGYTFPKPLIEVNGKPMIQMVVENLQFKDAKYIFLTRKEHLEDYKGLQSTLQEITKGNCEIVEVDGLTEGAACTALLAKEFIDNDEELLIANSDQYIEWQPKNFEYLKNTNMFDGIVLCFNSSHPKWSFVRVDEDGYVNEVAEKNPISDIATTGIYWWAKGSDFVYCAEKMIDRNIRVNNEFYIAPVYNELIKEDGELIPFYVQEMWGTGTPEDLNVFLGEKK